MHLYGLRPVEPAGYPTVMNAPTVSVVLPFRNAEATLAETLDSIAAQTLTDFELIAVDDGSTDAGALLLRDRARRDRRVRLVQAEWGGVVRAMNTGVDLARAPLVARMDADDRMHPQRLAAQAAFLADHPDVVLVGTQVRLFPEPAVADGFREYIRWQNRCLTPRDVRDEIYVELPIANPSVMYRRRTVNALGGYRDGPFPEDYELQLRLVHAGCALAKVPEVLLDWRDSPARLTRTDDRYTRTAFDRVRAAYLACDPRLRRDRPLAIWGAGRRSRRRADRLLACGFQPTAWIDVDPAKLGGRSNAVPVVPPAWLHRAPRPFVLSYVNSRGARERIAAFLNDHGYRRGDDYLFVG